MERCRLDLQDSGTRLQRRHRWNDQLVRRVLPDVALQRLTTRIAASEQQHTGQIRLCAEGGLPWSYLLRNAPAREREQQQ